MLFVKLRYCTREEVGMVGSDGLVSILWGNLGISIYLVRLIGLLVLEEKDQTRGKLCGMMFLLSHAGFVGFLFTFLTHD